MSLKSKTGMSIRLIAIIAVLAAFSIVFGKYLQIPVGDSIRISFENLPIIMCSILLGPIAGILCGVCADIIGCFMVGFVVNPMITVGAGFIGMIPGVLVRYVFKRLSLASVFISVASAHLIGSIIIKSTALMLWFGTPWSIIIWRIPIYAFVAVAEGYIIYLMHKKDVFKRIYPEGVSK